jgi:hypothetical protein
MAEANKCDVVNCGEFSEGSPFGKFMIGGEMRTMCKKHAEALVESYFPDLKKQPEPEPQPAASAENSEATATAAEPTA